MRNRTLVTVGGWCVSGTTGSGIPAGFTRLSVFRPLDPGHRRVLRSRLDRLLVRESEKDALLVAHGFLQPFFRVDKASFKARHRVSWRAIRRAFMSALPVAQSREDVWAAQDLAREQLRLLGCDVLVAMSLCNGLHYAARKLRPDLMAAPVALAA